MLACMTDRSRRATRAELERQVREYFPRQVAACEDLLGFTVEMMEEVAPFAVEVRGGGRGVMITR